MSKITIKEITSSDQNVKVAILTYIGTDDPVRHLNAAVSQYVQYEPYNEFIDANMDNPWVRVIIKGMNEIDGSTFDAESHRI